ncbi:gamma-glutamyltransferase [Lujinxingia vulgaris]|uniref:Gamma-glutamyltransferase n=2 Tax=Lujinxingia vulgaris TaxID=2600176 RepID=A0A5C6X8I4_9DELT|nr:gamma-glutamyltransferase [Lujinxingia vulgaris]
MDCQQARGWIMTRRMDCFSSVTIALLLCGLSLPAMAQESAPTADAPAPPDYSQHRVRSSAGLVAADHQLASEAGAAMLAAGGNAADAGAAAMLAVGLTNPFASGLGGGGFCLYREVDTGETTVIDYRERAPGAAHRDMYLVDGEPDPQLARHGGLAVGVPGEAAGIWSLHGRFGELEWERIVEPALNLASEGYPVGATLARHLQTLAPTLEEWPELKAVFTREDGNLVEEGDILVREDLARALQLLRDEGVQPFYTGEIAEATVEAVQEAGGILTLEDLKRYQVAIRQPVTGTYNDFEIISMPPPSSGGVALIEAFNILEGFELESQAWDAPAIHLIVEALKHAFADRAAHLGDSDFVDVPVDRLISKDYAAQLRETIELNSTKPIDAYGSTAPSDDPPGTSHLSVVDAAGNMLACTTTINTRFGSLVYDPNFGLIFNNEMADFNTAPGQPNLYGLMGNEQNAVAPDKRPLSSMSPTLVLKNGEPFMSLGGSGGPTIITGTYFTMVATMIFGRDLLDAVSGPRMHHQWLPEQLFVEFDNLPFAPGLVERGHQLQTRRAYNAVQAIMRQPDGSWTAVSDPRKGGIPAAPQTTTEPIEPQAE